MHLINQEILLSLQATVEKSVINKWEILKSRIKKATLKFSKNNVKEEKIVISALAEKVNELEARMPLDEKDDKIWKETKTELEEKMLQRTKGMLFRSKVKWQEEGEKNTKYFFSLEKIEVPIDYIFQPNYELSTQSRTKGFFRAIFLDLFLIIFIRASFDAIIFLKI